MISFDELFSDVTRKGKKIPTKEYLSTGRFPIVDQGKKVIAGYSNDAEGLYTDVPAIVFGDHTRIVKYIDQPFFLGADGAKIITCNDEQANVKYWYYALKAARIPDTGYNRHFKWLKELYFHRRTVQEQERIVNIFSGIDLAVDNLELQLFTLDKLVKSRFIEMFGDPVTNPMGWDTGTLADVIRTKASNGFFAKRNAYKPDGNVAVLGVVDVVNRMYSKTTDLPRTDATKTDIEKYRVDYGDILFCRSSLVKAGIGKASIVPKGVSEDILFECHVIRLQLDMNKCIPEFIQLLTATEYCRNQIMAVSKTATMTTIGQDGILATKIYIPPLDLQNEFLTFVQLTDKSKSVAQALLAKFELLREKLMHDYFG